MNKTKKDIILQGVNNCPIQARCWLPEGDVKAVLHILHGMAEHCLRYENFALWLAEQGIAVYAHDHRQHGQSIGHDSPGIYDRFDTWEAMMADVDKVQGLIRESHSSKPMFLLGHSMGSLLARSYLQRYDRKFDAAIIMGSPYSKKAVLKAGRTLATLVSKFGGRKRSPLLDNLAVGPFSKAITDAKTSVDWLSYDPANVKAYIEDPLCGYVYSANFYRQLIRGSLYANNEGRMKEFPKIPTLFISGADDPCGANGKGVQAIADGYKARGVRVRLKLMKHMRHEILNEHHKSAVYEAVLAFIEKQL